jgi:hypothetical protein
LTDFGAATFYDRDKYPEYEYYDVRAFGYLMEELLSSMDCNYGYNPKVIALQEIKNACLMDNVSSRPRFREIY